MRFEKDKRGLFMKMKLFGTLLGLTLSTVIPASAVAAATSLSNDKDKLSYSIGADLGSSFKKQDIGVNPSIMLKGIEDALNGGPMLLTEEQRQDVLNKFQKDLMNKRNAEFTKKSEDNKAKGEAFLAQNKSKPGVVTLPSGLQYKIIDAGNGAKPTKEDTVTVDYKGTLINGEVFDSTEKSGKPATFKLSQVIPGWTEVMQLMPTGATWEVYIPSNLAYGPRNVGSSIGPNETLIFKIHLLSVKKTAE